MPSYTEVRTPTTIINTLSNESQLSQITVDENEIILVPDDTDEQLANKVDKVNTEDRVYGTDSQGAQTTYNLSDLGQIDTIQIHGVDQTITSKTVDLSVVEQFSTLPVGSVDYLGRVVQYTGSTTSSFTHNYFYEGKQVPGEFQLIETDPIYNITISDQQKMEDGIAAASTSLGVTITELRFELAVMGSPMLWNVIAYEADSTSHAYITEGDLSTLESTYGFSVSISGPGQQVGDGFIVGYPLVYGWEQVDVQPKTEIIDNVTSTSTTAALSARQGKVLQDRIDDLSGRGRYLTLWDCSTGLAVTNPPESPYIYKTGDYFIVSVVASESGTNYKPDGSSYIIGTASTTVETDEVSVDDTYVYDGTTWHLQYNSQKTVSFSAIGGDPYDNTALSNALDAKQDVLTAGDGININNNTVSTENIVWRVW